jgi:uncharacterized protein with ParB-like and HNH nuclease domain
VKILSLDKTIQEVLSLGYYRIPRFQRPFSWEKDQIEEFWTDTIADNEVDYFIGSMVVYEDDKQRKIFGIVDGQQRLTTITLMLCALRNAFVQEGLQAQADGVNSLIERRNIDNEPEFVLQPETSYPYFQEHIQKWGNPDTQGKAGAEEFLLKNAFDLLSGTITETVNAIKLDPSLNETARKKRIKEKLVQIRSRVLGLKVIHITLDDEDDAYIIFETMNTRGKDLTLSDLLKSYLLKLIRPKNAKVDIYKEKWAEMVRLFEESNTKADEFLYHHWLSKYERYVPAKKLFKSIRRNVKANNAKAYFDELYRDAKIYCAIVNPTPQAWPKQESDIRNSLRAFSIFRVKQEVPMLLAVLRDYKAGKLKFKHVLGILTAIENFHFIFSAITSQRSSGGISGMYASHALKLVNSSTVDERVKVLQSLKAELQKRIPSYQEFEANFKEIQYSDSFDKQKKLVQYILAKIDLYHQEGLPIDYEQMTIEHLAAQKPKVRGIGENCIGQLGNLLLVNSDLNAKLANKPFEEKKPILQSSRVWVDDNIVNASSWGEQEIEGRTKELANIAYEAIWKV